MSEKFDLKNCPFCNGAPSVIYRGGDDERNGYNFSASVSCQSCGGSVSVISKSDKNGWCTEELPSASNRASEAWNRRHSEDQPSVFNRCLNG